MTAVRWSTGRCRPWASLYRGSQTPPPDMDHYPEECTPHFFFIENHVLTVCEAIGDRTDQEMEEVYAMLRRRPDGRSLGALHDFLWQVSALLLGTQVLSAAEFEALVGAPGTLDPEMGLASGLALLRRLLAPDTWLDSGVIMISQTRMGVFGILDMQTRSAVATCVTICVLTASAGFAQTKQPGWDWTTASPESQGMSSKKLKEMTRCPGRSTNLGSPGHS